MPQKGDALLFAANEVVVGEVAVAIKHVYGGQLHVGLVYGVGEDVILLHLADHEDLRRQVLPLDTYKLAVLKPVGVPAIWARRLKDMAAYFESIWQENGASRMPYSISNGSSLDAEGRFVPSPHGVPGFTCAAFVLAAFDAAQYPLIKGEWPPPDEEDTEWQEYIVGFIYGADSELQERSWGDCGVASRYRPEHVAAAAVASTPPSTYTQLEPEAALIRDELVPM